MSAQRILSASLAAVSRCALLVPALAVVLVVFWWFVTHGTWKLLDAEDYGVYYDGLAKRMWEGRLDVTPADISGEAFVRDGKVYGYFGPGPAFLRIPFNHVWPDMYGKWSRSFMFGCCVITLLAAQQIYAMLRRRARAEGTAGDGEPQGRPPGWFEKWLEAGFVLSVGLGSTTIFLASRAYIYHEANMWGTAFALVFAWCALLYLNSPRWWWLAGAGLAASVSFLSRPTIGAGALLGCLLLWALLVLCGIGGRRGGWPGRFAEQAAAYAGMARSAVPLRHAALIALLAGGCVAAYFAMNWAKFRTLDGVPVKYYLMYLESPERMARTQGKQMHLVNFRTGVKNTFGHSMVKLDKAFPWVQFTGQAVVYPEARYDFAAESSGIPFSMPALFLASTVGLVALGGARSSAVRRFRLPTVALLGGACLIFFTVSCQERYLHDFVPYMVLAGAVGLHSILRVRPRSSAVGDRFYRAAVLVVLVPATVVGVWMNLAFAFEYEATLVWGVRDERKSELAALRDRVDHFFSNPRLVPAVTDTAKQVPPGRRGQLWKVRSTGAVYWFNGKAWQTVSPGTTVGAVRLRVTFDAMRPPGAMEPILTSGKTEAGDFVFVRYEEGNKVRFVFDHWGAGGPSTRKVPIVPGKTYPMLIDLDEINGMVRIEFDGKELIAFPAKVNPVKQETLWLGTNPIGGSGPTGPFPGKVERGE